MADFVQEEPQPLYISPPGGPGRLKGSAALTNGLVKIRRLVARKLSLNELERYYAIKGEL